MVRPSLNTRNMVQEPTQIGNCGGIYALKNFCENRKCLVIGVTTRTKGWIALTCFVIVKHLSIYRVKINETLALVKL